MDTRLNPLNSDKVHAAAAAAVTDASIVTAKTNTSITSNGTDDPYNPKDMAIIHEDIIIFMHNINRFPSHGVQHPLLTMQIATGTAATTTSTKHNLASAISLSKVIQQMRMTTAAQGYAVFIPADVHHLHNCGPCMLKLWCCTRSWCCASCHCMLPGSRQLLLPPPPPSSNQCLASSGL